jgi:hypothetical protein
MCLPALAFASYVGAILLGGEQRFKTSEQVSTGLAVSGSGLAPPRFSMLAPNAMHADGKARSRKTVTQKSARQETSGNDRNIFEFPIGASVTGLGLSIPFSVLRVPFRRGLASVRGRREGPPPDGV